MWVRCKCRFVRRSKQSVGAAVLSRNRYIFSNRNVIAWYGYSITMFYICTCILTARLILLFLQLTQMRKCGASRLCQRLTCLHHRLNSAAGASPTWRNGCRRTNFSILKTGTTSLIYSVCVITQTLYCYRTFFLLISFFHHTLWPLLLHENKHD